MLRGSALSLKQECFWKVLENIPLKKFQLKQYMIQKKIIKHILFPNSLFHGIFSSSKLRTPRIKLFGFFINSFETEKIHSIVCCPSESAVTVPIASGQLSKIYENAVF